MREFQVRHKIRKILYSKTAAVVIVIMIAFAGHAAWGVLQKERESSANTLQATKELERLSGRSNLLQAEIGRLSTDSGIEEEIRTKYNVSKPGEHFFVIVDNNPTSTATSSPEQSWWKKVTGVFK